MGTAFTLLVFLSLLIALIGWTMGFIDRRAAGKAVAEPLPDDTAARDRALAAVVAVSALLELKDARSQGALRDSTGDSRNPLSAGEVTR